MKSKIIILGIMILGVYFLMTNNLHKFSNVRIGTKVVEIRMKWGKPTYIRTSDTLEFVDIYKTSFIKYVFIYTKKDSLLIKKWKENF